MPAKVKVTIPKINIKPSPGITVSGDYLRLENKPQIGGITLEGDKSLEDLSILSSNSTRYQEISLDSANPNLNILLVAETGETKKIKISNLISGRVVTASSVTEELENGSYTLKLIDNGGN